jgi:hypothetical protein
MNYFLQCRVQPVWERRLLVVWNKFVRHLCLYFFIGSYVKTVLWWWPSWNSDRHKTFCEGSTKE